MSAVGTRNPLLSGGNAPGASASDLEAIQKLGAARKKLKEEIAKVIIGQEHIVDDLLTALFARGHCLMIGVPGLAKTLMVRTIAQAIDLQFNRIQFTPDLMPSDITGTEIIEEDKATGSRQFRFVKGPVFAKSTTADVELKISKVLTGPEIIQLQQIVRKLPVSDHVGMYAVNLARSTRPDDEIAPGFTREFVNWGAGTRAVQYLVLGAKARAAIAGEYNVTCDHVRAVAPLVLRHRVMTNFHGEAEGMTPDKIVRELLKHVSEPRPEDYK